MLIAVKDQCWIRFSKKAALVFVTVSVTDRCLHLNEHIEIGQKNRKQNPCGPLAVAKVSIAVQITCNWPLCDQMVNIPTAASCILHQVQGSDIGT